MVSRSRVRMGRRWHCAHMRCAGDHIQRRRDRNRIPIKLRSKSDGIQVGLGVRMNPTQISAKIDWIFTRQHPQPTALASEILGTIRSIIDHGSIGCKVQLYFNRLSIELPSILKVLRIGSAMCTINTSGVHTNWCPA